MKLTKCPNNHYFDSDKYDVCPHCGANAAHQANERVSVSQGGEGDAQTGFSRKGNTASFRATQATDLRTSSLWERSDSPHGSDFGETESEEAVPPQDPIARRHPVKGLDEIEPGEPVSPMRDDTRQTEMSAAYCTNCGAKLLEGAFFCINCGNKTERRGAALTAAGPSFAQAVAPDFAPPPGPVALRSGAETTARPYAEGPAPEPVPTPDAKQNDPQSPHPAPDETPPNPTYAPQSLRSAVNAVAANGPIEDVKTMAFYNLDDTEPVVAWLVCLRGAYPGQSFTLKTGRNNIGRAMNMDVALAKETSVSRNKHAVLTYEPQKRAFYIQPGDGNGLTYLNDEPVLTFVPVKNRDKIKMGNSMYIFLSLCGEDFTWDDYIG
jgi:predicted RNA-binding Zn-ribbon protein involved in translation (DUF1610 family)